MQIEILKKINQDSSLIKLCYNKEWLKEEKQCLLVISLPELEKIEIIECNNLLEVQFKRN
jgi:hypothetical protein